MADLTEAQLYDLGNVANGSLRKTEFEAAVKRLLKIMERQAKQIDKLKKRVKKLENQGR